MKPNVVNVLDFSVDWTDYLAAICVLCPQCALNLTMVSLLETFTILHVLKGNFGFFEPGKKAFRSML